MENGKCIEVNGLKKFFGEIKAVNGISFNVGKGTVLGMLGPNGAGKSTTIETLVGLQKRDAGKVNILGRDPEQNTKELKELIGVQLQSPALFAKLKVKELAALFASFYQNPFPVDEAIQMVNLESKLNAHTSSLSGGQRHRLAVALAVISNGEILFLDEPTTGLDPQSRRNIWDLITNLKQMGKTIFMTTHYMDEAEKLCDHLLIIDQGQVIARGTPKKLIEDYFDEDAIEFINPAFDETEMQALQNLSSITKINIDTDNKILLYTRECSQTIADLMDYGERLGKSIDGINIRKPTLDDLFLKLTGRMIKK